MNFWKKRKRGKPYEKDIWCDRMIKEHSLEATVRGKGRPKKGT